MKKRKIRFKLSSAVFLLLVVLLPGCVYPIPNRPETYRLLLSDNYLIELFPTCRIDPGTRTISYDLTDEEKDYCREIFRQNQNNYDGYCQGSTVFKGPRMQIPEGFEKLQDRLVSLSEISDPILNYFGKTEENLLKGFVNFYSSTAGCLSGGGCLDARNVTKCIVFSYDKSSDELTTEIVFDKRMAVARQGDTVLYWKKKAFYAYDLSTGKETFLIKDFSYSAFPWVSKKCNLYDGSDFVFFRLGYEPFIGKKKAGCYIYDYGETSFYELQSV